MIRTLSDGAVTMSAEANVSTETLRLLLGYDPSKDEPAPSPMTMTWEWTDCPVVKPYKRRGLTGKAYRAARRRYRRDMRAWDRGLLPGNRMRSTVFGVVPSTVAAVPGSPGTYSIGFRGQPATHEPWWDL